MTCATRSSRSSPTHCCELLALAVLKSIHKTGQPCSDTPLPRTRGKALSAGCTNSNFDKSKKITQPGGAATPSGQRRA